MVLCTSMMYAKVC